MIKYMNAGSLLTNTPVDVFVCPPNSQSVVHSLFISCIDDKDNIHVTIEVYDASEGSSFYVGYDLEIMPKTTLSFDKPINLEASDVLRITTDMVNKSHAFASILNVVPSSL